ncbi:MAG: hypothetical protein AB7T49_14595 [Oligoflexales bacterium]
MKTKILPLVKALSVVLAFLPFACGKGPNDRAKSGTQKASSGSSKSTSENASSSPATSTDEDKISLDEFNALISGGVWETTNCLVKNAAESIWQIRTYEFKDNKKYWGSYRYSDANCRTKVSTTIWEESYSLGKFAEYLNVPKAFEIDTVLISVKEIIHDQALLDTYNTQSLYGYSDWTLEQPKDVTGSRYLPTSTEAFPAAGVLKYQIMAIVDGYLTNGATESGDATSPVTRPKALLTNVVYRKK